MIVIIKCTSNFRVKVVSIPFYFIFLCICSTYFGNVQYMQKLFILFLVISINANRDI